MRTPYLLSVVILVLTLSVALGQHFALAAINPQISFYGTLQNSSGTNLSGTYDMVFRFYTAPTGGTLLDTSTHTSGNGNPVTVYNGEFSVLLGSGAGNALDGVDFNSAAIYVGLSIAGDPEMTPRQRLTAAPYAFNTDTIDGVDSTELVRTNTIGSVAATTAGTLFTITQSGTGDILNLFDGGTEVFSVLDGGKVGIGTSTPFATFSVSGDASISGALYDNSFSAGQNGYVLQSTGSGFAWVATSTLGFGAGSNPFGASIDPTELTATDFGDFTCNGTTCTLDSTYLTTVDISADTNLAVTATGLTLAGDSIALAAGYEIPLSASTTAWNSFYQNPASGITAGTGLSWTGNTLNAEVQSSDLANYFTLSSWYATTTDALTEGSTNLYYSNSLVSSYISGSTTISRLGQSIDESELNIAGGPTDGYVLQANSGAGGGFEWVATSSLGIAGGSGSSLFTDGGATTYLTTLSDNLAIGTTTAMALLDVWGDFRVGSSTNPIVYVNNAHNQVLFGTSTPYASPGRLYLENYPITFRNTASLAQNASFAMDTSGRLNFHSTSGGGFVINNNGQPMMNALSNGIVFNDNNIGAFDFTIESNTDLHMFFVDSGNDVVGISTSTPSYTFTVDGDLMATGALYDNAYSAGSSGFVLQSTGSGFQWVATSTLGLGGSGGGSVTSVALSAPTGFTVSGSPVTTSGTLALSYAAGYEGLLTASSTNWNSFYNTPSTRITAGAGLSWTGNTLNAEVQSSDLANYLPLTGGTLSGNLAFSGTAANIALGSNYLSGDGDDEGISINSTGAVFVNSATQTLVGAGNADLVVVDQGDYAAISIDAYTTVGNPSLAFSRARGTEASPTAVQNGDVIMELDARPRGTSGFNTAIGIYGVVDGTPSGNNSPARINFGTMNTSGSFGQRMTIRADGQVGIGTSSPFATLTVAGDFMATGALYDNAYSAGSNGNILQSTGSGFNWVSTSTLGLASSASLANYLPLTGGTLSGNLAFSGTAANIALGSNYLSGDGGDEGISVDSSGNVSVTHSLTVSNNGYATVSLNGFSNTDFVGPLSKFDRARGTIGAPAVVQDGDILMELNAQGYSPSGSYEPGAEIVAQVDGTPSGTAVPGQLIFWTRAQGSSPARRMVIRADGKVGIGTTTPSHRLTVDGDMLSTGVLYVNDDTSYTGNESMLITNEGGYTTLAINAHSATSFAGSGITFRRGRGTIASPSVVQDGDLLMQLHPVGRGNTAWSGAADLTVSVDGAVSGNIIPSRFSFFTTPVGGTQAEVMRITSDGYVGIGTTSPTTILTVAGVVTPDADNVYSLGNSSYRWSEVYAANGTINTSDRRLKDNITDIGYGLNEVLLFDPVRFTWKDHPEQGERFGLIAQDVQQIIPEVVNVGDDPNHTLGIRYTELVAVLINAMQQMWDEITGNKEKIAELENRIEALEAATQTNTSSEQNAPRPATIVTVSSSTEPAVPDEAGEETASSTLSVDEPVISDTPEEQTTSSTPDLIPTPEPTIIATTTDES